MFAPFFQVDQLVAAANKVSEFTFIVRLTHGRQKETGWAHCQQAVCLARLLS
jgi:hypothetical protein